MINVQQEGERVKNVCAELVIEISLYRPKRVRMFECVLLYNVTTLF